MNNLSKLPNEISISNNLEIRKIKPSDAEDLYKLVKNNPDIPKRVAWAKYVKTFDDVIPSLKLRSDGTLNGRFVIISQGKIVGCLGVYETKQKNEYSMGYCLDKSARGKGYVTKVIKAMIEQLKNLGAKHFYFQIVPGNNDSIAIPKRLGFYPAETVMGIDFPVEQQRWRLDIK